MMISRFKLSLLALLLAFGTAYGAGRTPGMFYNVKDYGAVGDGQNLDSKGINKAIDAAAAAGGGTVYLPPGNYLSGSIRLKSNITLLLDRGATIIAAPISAENGYDDAEPGINTQYQDYGHSHFHNSLIWGEHLHDVAITGQGMIWGKGLYRDDKIKGTQTANKSIALLLCRNVQISGIAILHGGWFGILATGVDNLVISNIKEDTNRDGMDIDCCRNVHITDCSVNSPEDDGICLKSSYALGFARATANVTITGCNVSGFDEGTFLDGTYKKSNPNSIGRIKFGTESNGGFKNITISNCVFEYCHGLALESVDGALLEDVAISNITMRDIHHAPLFLRIGARMRGPADAAIGQLHRVVISNIVAYNVSADQGIIINGVAGHPVSDVDIHDVKIYFEGGGTAADAARQVPGLEKGYPDPERFGTLPAYGLYIRHAENISLNNISLTPLKSDQRPPVALDDVKGIDMNFVKAPAEAGVPAVSIKNAENVAVFHSPGLSDGVPK